MLKTSVVTSLICCFVGLGCADGPSSGSGERDPAQHFDDSAVVALCKAITRNDVQEIERLLDSGAQINANGKGNVTPLLWAISRSELATIQALLDRGANPNHMMETNDMLLPLGIRRGQSATQFAAEYRDNDIFEAVMTANGDPQQVNPITGHSLLHTVIRSITLTEKRERIEYLINAGTPLDTMDNSDATAAISAARNRRYDICLLLLDAGADPLASGKRLHKRIVHVICEQEANDRRLSLRLSPRTKQDLDRLLSVLQDAGESLESARAYVTKWKELSRTHGAGKAIGMMKDELELRKLEQETVDVEETECLD